MDEAWWVFSPSLAGVVSSPQSMALDLLTHKPTGDRATVLWARLLLFPHPRVLCLNAVPMHQAGDRSRTFGGFRANRGTRGLALSSKPELGLLPGPVAWF